MARDVFPETITTTWFDRQLDRGQAGLAEISRHVLEVYADPLRVYFRGMPDRRFLEPDEAVQGFLADRLVRPDFFPKWRGNGMPLRRWLMNAFRYYLMEERTDRERHHRMDALEGDPAEPHATPDEEIDRAFLVATVRAALRSAQASCERDQLTEHWDLFLGHFMHGRAYADLAEELGITARRAAVMARTARGRFRLAVLESLDRDGIAPEDIDAEIRSLLEAF